MFHLFSEEGRDLEALKRRYAEFQRRIETAVEKGELSREDAEKKLVEASQEMFGDRDAERSGRERIREERQDR